MGIFRKYHKPRIVTQSEWTPFWLRILLLLLVMLVTGWYGYQMGGGGLQNRLSVFSPSERERLDELEAEREELRRQLTMAQQSAEMDQEAIRAIKEQVKRFQDERLKMEEELAFLRGIVSAGPDKKGLRIQKFKLTPALEADDFNYQFTVSQVVNSGIVAKGKIHISLQGLQDGKAVTLGLERLTKDKKSSQKMRFRYFQNLEGKLKIPEGFRPAKFIIEIKPESKKFAPVTEAFDWKPVT
ncbi:MAG: hypothetical protein QNJ78_13230 [Gammaproteobacteria bacterium]|nr:hypothetical protein [Gammaproteobacteria bacterium]